MSANDTVYHRVLRREAHSSRAGLAITLAIILVIALAYVAIEAVLALAGQPPLLLSPAEAFRGVLFTPFNVESVVLVAAGAVLAVIGILLVVSALTPGRRADHESAPGRTAVLIDNRAIASALANRASYSAGVDPDQVVVSVGRRTAEIRIQPTSGWPVDRAAVEKAVAAEIEQLQLSPSLVARVAVSTKAKVGA